MITNHRAVKHPQGKPDAKVIVATCVSFYGALVRLFNVQIGQIGRIGPISGISGRKSPLPKNYETLREPVFKVP